MITKKKNVKNKPKKKNVGLPKKQVYREKKKTITEEIKEAKFNVHAKPFVSTKIPVLVLENDTEQKENAIRSMAAPAAVDTDSLHVFLYTALSIYTQKRITETIETIDHEDNDELQFFIASLGQYIISATSLKPHPLKEVPTWAWVVSNFLMPKSKKLLQSQINYTLTWPSLNYTLPNSFSTGVGTNYWAQGAVGNLIENLNSTPYVLNEEKFGQVLRVASDINSRFWKRIDSETPGLGAWTRDASAYARNYKYFGSGGADVFGLYNNAELEVPINYPLMSKFVEYKVDELAIARHFMPTSGGSSTIAGTMLLHDKFGYKHLKSRVPVVYKFIDFWEIYLAAASQLALVYSNMKTEGGLQKREQFPFGPMDFAVALRQAVLSVFVEQSEGQFIAPYGYAGASPFTTFQPFVVDPIGMPSPAWTSFVLSTLLKSNLSFLREYIHYNTSKQYGTEKKAQFIRYVPVIGVFKDDIPPLLNYKNLNGSGYTALFGPNIIATSAFNLSDMRLVSGNQKYNPNHKLFVSVMTSWNSYVENIAGNTTGTAMIASDIAPLTNLLFFTRQLDIEVPALGDDDLIPSIPSMYDQMIGGQNVHAKEKSEKLVIKKGEKERIPIGAPQPATLSTLSVVALHSVLDISCEIKGIVDQLILPMIRLTNQTQIGVPQLTLRQYKTYTGEIHQISYNAGYSDAGRRQDKRIFLMMNNTVIAEGGTVAGINDLTKAVTTLEEEGVGGDLLGALLGGMLSSVPVIGPIAGALLNAF